MRKFTPRKPITITLDAQLDAEFTKAIPYYQKSRYIEIAIREFLERKNNEDSKSPKLVSQKSQETNPGVSNV